MQLHAEGYEQDNPFENRRKEEDEGRERERGGEDLQICSNQQSKQNIYIEKTLIINVKAKAVHRITTS